MSKIYKTSPEIIFTTKDGELKLIFLNEEKNHFYKLKGAAAESLKFFDGKRDLTQIKKELDQAFNITTSDDSGFKKLIEFLIKNEIIIEA